MWIHVHLSARISYHYLIEYKETAFNLTPFDKFNFVYNFKVTPQFPDNRVRKKFSSYTKAIMVHSNISYMY
jgi:hypothetical protein